MNLTAPHEIQSVVGHPLHVETVVDLFCLRRSRADRSDERCRHVEGDVCQLDRALWPQLVEEPMDGIRTTALRARPSSL